MKTGEPKPCPVCPPPPPSWVQRDREAEARDLAELEATAKRSTEAKP